MNTLFHLTTRMGRCCVVAVAVIGCATVGCKAPDLMGEGFQRDPTFDWTHEVRPGVKNDKSFGEKSPGDKSSSSDFSGVSNKAREIERDCGIR